MTRTEDEEWAVERERFVVLLHLYTLRELTPAASWTAERMMRDLGFTRERADLVLNTLVSAGFLTPTGAGEGLALTQRATAYLETEAGRRRSVRLVEHSPRNEEVASF